MNNYELTYIVSPVLDDASRKELIDRFTGLLESNGAVVEKVDETFWGKRKLAYPINDMTEGYYVLTLFKANSDVPREIERNLQISDKILRYLVIKVEDKLIRAKNKPVKKVEKFVEVSNDEEKVEAADAVETSDNE